MWPSSGEEGLDVGRNVGSAVKGGRNGLCIHRISMVRRWGGGGERWKEEEEEETTFFLVPWKWVF